MSRTVVVILISLMLVVNSACGAISDTVCSVELVSEIPSPNAGHKAVTRIRNCGATTDYVSEVSIFAASRTNYTGYGNTFRAKGYLDLAITWQNDTELTITYPAGIRVYQADTEEQGITISYAETK